jgi:hypothetical protein
MNIPTPLEPCTCGSDVFQLKTVSSLVGGSGNVEVYFKLSTGHVEARWMCAKCYTLHVAATAPDSRNPEGT